MAELIALMQIRQAAQNAQSNAQATEREEGDL
jgi:hypothetical protein